jgi:penicillin amidase
MTPDTDSEPNGSAPDASASDRETDADGPRRDATDEDAWRTTRRGLVAALVGGGTLAAGVSPLGEYLGRVAPLSGRAWRHTGGGPDTVQSPYGAATVTYDDHHTPHVAADEEAAAYYALGYVHASDRLFQMDLVRRQASGRLAEIVGPPAVEADVFNRKLDLKGAAAASRQAIAGTAAARAVEAYSEGVTTYIEEGAPGTEFGLLGYEPEPWDVLDALLVVARFGWLLSGQFQALRRSVTRRTFDDELHAQLYPGRFDHDAPILRGVGDNAQQVTRRTNREPPGSERIDAAMVEWLGQFERPEYVGSNAWTIPGEHTDTGTPILANDPHLALRAPPTVYEQQVTVGDRTVGGVTVAGMPFVVIGQNDHGAWGLTNASNVDVVDVYTYDVDGDRYRYRGEWREFETATQTVSVARGEDRTVEVRKTVHGPYIGRNVGGEQRNVGVAWPFLTGTRELQAWYELNRGDGADQFEAAVRKFDGFPLNVHYADRDGHTGYALTGKIPIRRVDGEVVRSDQVFDGSAGDAEWTGFEPYGQSTWEGFVSFEDKPSARDAGVVASANQKFAADRRYPYTVRGAAGFRAERIYERLDRATESGETVDRAFVEDVQLDILDVRARTLVPIILDAREGLSDRATPWVEALEDWDYRMERDSTAALVFAVFVQKYHWVAWSGFFESYDLHPGFWPGLRVLMDLPVDSEVFDGDRSAVVAEAMVETLDQIEAEGWETYGDYNVTMFDHPLGSLEPGLNYPRIPSDGSGRTVRAVSGRNGFGSAYRMVADLAGETATVLPGGNDGDYSSEHYHDQLGTWVAGEYTPLDADRSGSPDITFEGGER